LGIQNKCSNYKHYKQSTTKKLPLELVALASTIQSEKNHHQASGLFVYKH